MFKVGDLAVYPAHGVGVIQSIEKKQIFGNEQKFYILKILDNGMTIMIPTDNVENVGLRQVIDPREIPKIYEILQERDIDIDTQTWNRRYREYTEKIKTGSVYEIAEVLRDLVLLKYDKNLSFGERKMLDMARNLLIKEISVARNTETAVVEQEIHRLFEM
ncbi:MAG: CarD family transcriptional regulator [Thermodesulfobacteriota bacterium]